MNYFLKSKNRARGKFLRSLGLGLLIAVFFALFGFFAPTILSGFFVRLATPAWNLGNALSSETWTSTQFWRSKIALVEENKALKVSLEEARLKEVAYETLKDENNTLKESFGRELPQGFILAGVLARPPQIPYDTLLVDVGQKDGVRVGDSAFAADSIVLGTIIEVYESQSKIELYSNAARKTPAFISGTNMSVLLQGRGGGDFEIVLPRESPITEDDVFVVAGIEGFTVAQVKTIDGKSTDSFQNVLAESPVNTLLLRFVTIRRQ